MGLNLPKRKLPVAGKAGSSASSKTRPAKPGAFRRAPVPAKDGTQQLLVIGGVAVVLLAFLFLVFRPGKPKQPATEATKPAAAQQAGEAKPPTLEERLPKLPEARMKEIYAEASDAEKVARARAKSDLPDPVGSGNPERGAIANRPVRIERGAREKSYFSAAKRELAAKHHVKADELNAVIEYGAIKHW